MFFRSQRTANTTPAGGGARPAGRPGPRPRSPADEDPLAALGAGDLARLAALLRLPADAGPPARPSRRWLADQRDCVRRALRPDSPLRRRGGDGEDCRL